MVVGLEGTVKKLFTMMLVLASCACPLLAGHPRYPAPVVVVAKKSFRNQSGPHPGNDTFYAEIRWRLSGFHLHGRDQLNRV